VKSRRPPRFQEFFHRTQLAVEKRTVKDLVEPIAGALVDHPEHVQVRAVEGEQVTLLELRVHPEDIAIK
jgi:hypothetical protein